MSDNNKTYPNGNTSNISNRMPGPYGKFAAPGPVKSYPSRSMELKIPAPTGPPARAKFGDPGVTSPKKK